MTLFDMSGKVAVITGASRGIGRAIAERMAEHGARVVISSRKAEACEAVAKEIRDAGGKAESFRLDVAKRDWSEKLLAAGSMSIDQMPKLYEGTDATGRLTPAVAKAWGMPKRPVVAGGGGDTIDAAAISTGLNTQLLLRGGDGNDTINGSAMTVPIISCSECPISTGHSPAWRKNGRSDPHKQVVSG